MSEVVGRAKGGIARAQKLTPEIGRIGSSRRSRAMGSPDTDCTADWDDPHW